ncbi:hypothetical protein R75461_07129 [Paraburkholderia nemoris]|nr:MULTISPECIES: hypothetical protein [Paraburkholderia]CAE6843361.1 hypothetical protein R75461_07129 [Paraburkholderia nemoris]
MKKIAFGMLRFDRRSIPPDLTDIGQGRAPTTARCLTRGAIC